MYLLIGEVVIKPYSCIRTNSTAMSFFELIVVGGFPSKAGFSSIGVNFTVKSFLMPMSNVCLANMSCNSTSNCLVVSRACLPNLESVQSKLDKNNRVTLDRLVGLNVQASVKLSVHEVYVSVLEYWTVLSFVTRFLSCGKPMHFIRLLGLGRFH